MKRLLIAATVLIAATSCSKDDSKDPVDFTASKTTITAGESVTFTSTGTATGAFTWNFGDGVTSTEQNPTHVFKKAGSNSVTLSVSGVSEVKTKSVAVNGLTFSVKNTCGYGLSQVTSYFYTGSEIIDMQIVAAYMMNGSETEGYISKHDKVSLCFTFNGKLYLVVDDYMLTNNVHKVLEITPNTQIYTGSRGLSRAEMQRRAIMVKDL